MDDAKTHRGASYLINGRLLYEPWGVSRQQAVGGHDVDLIGSSLLQNLSCCHKILHVIYDVVLGNIDDV